MENLIIAGLATYRLALFISEDEGPFKIFSRLREWAVCKADTEKVKLGISNHSLITPHAIEAIISECERSNPFCLKWATLAEGLHCPYCVGMYMAILTYAVSQINSGVTQGLLKILAIAGLQSAVRMWATR